jgi:hypothetical protein
MSTASNSPYAKQTKFTDATITTSEHDLYYSRYNLAKNSEYFYTMFNSEMRDISKCVVNMEEYTPATITVLLNMLDNKYTFNKDIMPLILADDQILLKILNFYNFADILKKILNIIADNLISLQEINKLYIPEFIDGPYKNEFVDAIDKSIINYCKDVSKCFIYSMSQTALTTQETIEKLTGISEYIYKKVLLGLINVASKSPTYFGNSNVIIGSGYSNSLGYTNTVMPSITLTGTYQT